MRSIFFLSLALFSINAFAQPKEVHCFLPGAMPMYFKDIINFDIERAGYYAIDTASKQSYLVPISHCIVINTSSY